MKNIPFWLKAVIAILVVETLGFFSGYITMGSLSGWYETLERPAGTPPNWIFGPVWTLLYAMMGLAYAILWDNKDAELTDSARMARRLFVIQLCLNLLWTPLFFGMHRLGPALVLIIVLVLAIQFTIMVSKKISIPAAALLVPYLLWVCYATYLNYGFWKLNG